MAGLCESGNEPPGSLKSKAATDSLRTSVRPWPDNWPVETARRDGNINKNLIFKGEGGTNEKKRKKHRDLPQSLKKLQKGRKNDAETDQKEEKELVGSLIEKKLPSEGRTGRNDEREKSSGQKKISDDRRH
ncbi:hypothetical protein ANN_24302 [Periplaneta americana]|uniref:Uncharacterized protein n=1 Tax=Periplaneta americana TaxID=6978 RepID=A0ABQ8S318_PERAM|nr:hypothetical protein ANN_24302 [Periplaneta americana]